MGDDCAGYSSDESLGAVSGKEFVASPTPKPPTSLASGDDADQLAMPAIRPLQTDTFFPIDTESMLHWAKPVKDSMIDIRLALGVQVRGLRLWAGCAGLWSEFFCVKAGLICMCRVVKYL
jgi:hypothetical protein